MIPPVLVREQRVLRLAGRDPVEVVREEALQQLERARAFDLDLAHVGDVEHAGVGANRAVLLDDALVLHRHLPAGEGDHPRAERDVPVVKWCALKRLRHAEPILVTGLAPSRGDRNAPQNGAAPAHPRMGRGGGPGRGAGRMWGQPFEGTRSIPRLPGSETSGSARAAPRLSRRAGTTARRVPRPGSRTRRRGSAPTGSAPRSPRGGGAGVSRRSRSRSP